MNVKSIAKNIWLSLSTIRLIPHILLIRYHPMREIVEKDIEKWVIERRSCIKITKKSPTALGFIYIFIQLMTYYPEFRSLFYYRVGWITKILYPLCRPMLYLDIFTKDIGSGLFIQHGFGTGIAAKKIGKNCTINHEVTIGFSNDTDSPTIGNNVIIHAGAKVIGDVTIGDNVIVGANAVVVKNVPANCTVVGVPAYIVRRNGVKVKESL